MCVRGAILRVASMTIRATWRLSQVARPGQLALLGRIGQSVDNLALLWEGNDPATMRWRLHGECCFTK